MNTKKYSFEISDSDELKAVIRNGGWNPYKSVSERNESTDRLTIKDTIFSSELGPWVKNSIVEIMMEPMQAALTLSPLLDSLEVPQGNVTEFRFPSLSAIRVHKKVEGQGYQEDRITAGGGMSTASIDSWGASFSMTKEAMEASNWDLVAYYLKAVGIAFANRQETEVAAHIFGLGQPVFDNLNPTLSSLGTTTGRAYDLTANGTLTVDDIFDAYSTLIERGFRPDTMICHPMAYMMFIKDPNLRAFAYQNGGGVIFGNYSGSAVNHRQIPDALKRVYGKGFANGGLGARADGTTLTPADYNTHAITAAPQLPVGLPFTLNIVTSLFVPYDPGARLTDIVLCERAALGAVFDSGKHTEVKWVDPEKDVMKWRWDKKWGLFRYQEGLGSITLKNIKLDTNYATAEVARATFDIDNVSVIDRTVAVV